MIVILTSLLLVFTGRYLIKLGHEISTELLKNLIMVETGGTYDIDFEDVSLNLRKKKLSVSKLRLIPNVNPQTYPKTIYEVDIDSVVLNLESLKSIYLKRELSIDSVKIIDPRLLLTNSSSGADSSNFSSQTGDIYKIISDQLSLLSINYFEVLNGDVAHRPSNFGLAGIHVDVSGFLVDSTSQAGVLHSTDISIVINEQRLLLPDSIHEIGFERFHLSTTDSVLRFQNAFIRPTSASQVSFSNINNINVYDIKIPEFEIRGIDYNRAYAENVLSVDKIRVRTPSIQLDDETSNVLDTAKQDNNLLKLLTNVFGRVDVDTFLIDEANIDLKLYSGNNKQRLSSKRTNLELFGITLDTMNAELSNQYSYYDSAKVTLFDYQYDLPDSIHVVKAGQIQLSTKDKSIVVQDVSLRPDKNPNSSKTLIYFSLPSGYLTGVDFEEILLGDQLLLRDFSLQSPQLTIHPDLRDSRKQENLSRFTTVDLYNLLKIRYQRMFSSSFTIESGRVEIDKQGAIEDIDINVGNISLRSNTRLWSQLIQYADISTGSVNWRLDTLQLKAEQVSISDKGATINVENAGVEGEDLDLSFRTTSLIVKGNNIDSLTMGSFDSDTILIRGPVVSGNIDRLLTSNSNDSIRKTGRSLLPKGINHLIVEDGRIDVTSEPLERLTLDDLDVSLNQSKTQPLQWLSFSNLSGTISKQIPVVYSMSSLDYQKSERQLIAEGIKVLDTDSIDISINQLVLKQLYQKGMFYDGFFLASNLEIKGLMGRLYPERFKAFVTEEKGAAKPKISLASASISNIEVILPKTSSRGLISLNSGNFELKTISTLDHEVLTDKDFLFGRNAKLTGNLLFSEAQQDLKVEDFTITSQPYSFRSSNLVYEQDSTLAIDLFGLDIENLSMDKLTNENELSISSLSTASSKISVIQQDQELSSSILKLPLKIVKIDSLTSKANDLVLVDEVMSRQTELNQLRLNATDLQLDSLTDVTRWFRYVSNVEFAGSDFNEKISDDYSMKVGSYAYQQVENRVDLKDVHLQPSKDKYAYSSTLSTQKSWFDVTVSSVSIQKPDLNLLAEGRLSIPRVELMDVYADIYRDKTVPFPENQYRPMPQKSLHDLNFPGWIDTLMLTANIRYSERPAGSDMEGLMTFDGLEGEVLNIRTMDTLSQKNMQLKARGSLYNSAPFEVSVSFDQQGPDYPFRMIGNVTDFDLTTLNQILGPAAGVNIRSGYGESITFNFTANDDIAEGEMRFRYDDLKIDILNKKTHEAQGLGRGIKTFFANTFVVKKKNMGFAFFVKKGQIFYERDTSRAVINYWGKALISGAISSVGINKSNRDQKKYFKSQKSD